LPFVFAPADGARFERELQDVFSLAASVRSSTDRPMVIGRAVQRRGMRQGGISRLALPITYDRS